MDNQNFSEAFEKLSLAPTKRDGTSTLLIDDLIEVSRKIPGVGVIANRERWAILDLIKECAKFKFDQKSWGNEQAHAELIQRLLKMPNMSDIIQNVIDGKYY
jgi:hypothetical protein